MKKLSLLKKAYYNYLDRKARNLAHILKRRKNGTKLLLDYIEELYDSAKTDAEFGNEKFEAAYHNPISSELEFLVARTLYHYSNLKDLGWKIYLRRQRGKTAPDIRIDIGKRTIAVIEIKAKAGWIQPFFNIDRYKGDMLKFNSGKSLDDPRLRIAAVTKQFKKYYQEYKIKPKQVFIFLPTLIHVHRTRSKRTLINYLRDFARNSRLPESNLILLSGNLSLDLSRSTGRKNYQPTDHLEKLISRLERL